MRIHKKNKKQPSDYPHVKFRPGARLNSEIREYAAYLRVTEGALIRRALEHYLYVVSCRNFF